VLLPCALRHWQQQQLQGTDAHGWPHPCCHSLLLMQLLRGPALLLQLLLVQLLPLLLQAAVPQVRVQVRLVVGRPCSTLCRVCQW
jgi:hypothetical protein